MCVFLSSMLQIVNEWLWWERLWLPANISWADLQDNESHVYAKGSHLYASLPCAFCMLLIRYLFVRCDHIQLPIATVWILRTVIILCKCCKPVFAAWSTDTRQL